MWSDFSGMKTLGGMPLGVAILAGFCVIGPAANAGDLCSDILKDGIFDLTQRDRLDWEKEVTIRNVCTRAKSSKSGGLTAPIGSFPAELTYKDSDMKSQCEQFNKNKETLDHLWESYKTANTSIISAWKECMQSDGVRFSLEDDPANNAVIGHLSFKSSYIGPNCDRCTTFQGKIGGILQFASCTCDPLQNGSCKRHGEEIDITLHNGNDAIFRCQRNDKSRKAIEMNLSSDWGNPEADLPASPYLPMIEPGNVVPSAGESCSPHTKPSQAPLSVALKTYGMKEGEWLTINNWGLHTVPPTTGWPIKFGEKHVLSDVTLSAQSSGRLVQHSKDGNVVGENGLYASADKTLGVPIILQRFNRNCIKTGTAYARYATIEITVVNGDQ